MAINRALWFALMRMAGATTSPNEIEPFGVFAKYVAKRKIRIPKCSVCNAHDWQFEGIKVALDVDHIGPNSQILVGSKASPMAHLLCTNCNYVLQFAWFPILREVQNG